MSHSSKDILKNVSSHILIVIMMPWIWKFIGWQEIQKFSISRTEHDFHIKQENI